MMFAEEALVQIQSQQRYRLLGQLREVRDGPLS